MGCGLWARGGQCWSGIQYDEVDNPGRPERLIRWLVTVDASTDEAELRVELSAVQADLQSDLEPVPLEPDEMMVFVNGPSDLASRLGPATPHLRAAYPDSEVDLYEDPGT